MMATGNVTLLSRCHYACSTRWDLMLPWSRERENVGFHVAIRTRALNLLFWSLFSRGYAKHRNNYLWGDRLCKCVTHTDVNFWPRTWRVWVRVSCRPPKLREAILVLVVHYTCPNLGLGCLMFRLFDGNSGNHQDPNKRSSSQVYWCFLSNQSIQCRHDCRKNVLEQTLQQVPKLKWLLIGLN